MNFKKVSLHIKDHLACLEFFHPKANALDKEIIRDLTKNFEELKKDKKIKSILFYSQNENCFSSGLFLDDLANCKSFDEAKEIFSSFAGLLFCMINNPKPIIGLFLGKAVGGALGLLAACDYVFAQNEAELKLSELSIGIAPLLIEPFLSQKMGNAHFEMALNPKTFFEASWAHQKGLINQVILEKEETKKQAENFAKTLAEYNNNAFYELKKIRWGSLNSLKRVLKERALSNASLYWKNKK